MSKSEGQSLMPDWRQIKGHDALLSKFNKLIHNALLPQVILLDGREGIGKSLVAASLIANHFCEEGGGCGRCSNCQLLLRDAHPEVLWIDSKGEKLKIASTGRVVEHLDFKPSHDLYKSDKQAEPKRIVVVIDADLLSEQAENKLLKTLEELQDDARVIMTTSHAHHLLPTFVSRCVKWNIKPPSIEDSLKIIEAKIGSEEFSRIGKGAIENTLRRLGRSCGKTLRFIQDVNFEESYKVHCENMLSSEYLYESLGYATELASDKEHDVGDFAIEVELVLNQLYKRSLKHRETSHLLDLDGMEARRALLAKLKRYAGQDKIRLNALLSCEGVALKGLGRS